MGRPRVAIITLTRDRLEYTKACLQRLWETETFPFDHFVWDNGSEDGTVEWLSENRDKFESLHLHPENVGISLAHNAFLDHVDGAGYDVVIKLDNDCWVKTRGAVRRVAEFVVNCGFPVIAGPLVHGLKAGLRVPKDPQLIARERFGDIGIGGIFMAAPGDFAHEFRNDVGRPKAYGQDTDIHVWAQKVGWREGHILTVEVEHYRTSTGQEADLPGYHARKASEVRTPPDQQRTRGLCW